MTDTDTRKQLETTVRALARVGAFHPAMACPDLTPGEIIEIMSETAGHDGVVTDDGWIVVLSSSTLLAVTLRRIAGALGDEPSLARVPRHEVVRSLAKAIGHSAPESSSFFEALPEGAALDTLLYLTGCSRDRDWIDFSTVTAWIGVDEREAAILKALKATQDCNLHTASLIRLIGMSGLRTTFNTSVIPSVPFIAGGYAEPVRLLGRRPHPSRLKKHEGGTFLGVEQSSCGGRVLVEYRLTEEMVETASFHVSSAARNLVAGTFRETRTDVDVRFNINTKHARKFAGLRTVVLRLYPDYVPGQRAFLLLDRGAGTACLEVIDATDYDGRARIRAMLDAAPQAAGVPEPAYAASMAA